ncbi:MAG: hypothetical protein H7256_10740 [Bdellovibrio sp.]|nr:hypothetical protein [Bdellovibrio sp.]
MTTAEFKVTPKDVISKNDERPSQHIGKSVDQVKIDDETQTQKKMGDNKAAAVPVSGSIQQKPHLKDCKK